MATRVNLVGNRSGVARIATLDPAEDTLTEQHNLGFDALETALKAEGYSDKQVRVRNRNDLIFALRKATNS